MNHVHLSRDADFLNRVMNDPSVYAGVSMGINLGRIDMSKFVLDEKNYFFANDHGGFLVLDKGDGIYEIHTQFLPAGRGKSAIRAGRESMEYMFTNTPCRALTTFCPLKNRAAAFLSKAVGMKRFKTETELGVDGDTYYITKGEWLCQSQSP